MTVTVVTLAGGVVVLEEADPGGAAAAMARRAIAVAKTKMGRRGTAFSLRCLFRPADLAVIIARLP